MDSDGQRWRPCSTLNNVCSVVASEPSVPATSPPNFETLGPHLHSSSLIFTLHPINTKLLLTQSVRHSTLSTLSTHSLRSKGKQSSQRAVSVAKQSSLRQVSSTTINPCVEFSLRVLSQSSLSPLLAPPYFSPKTHVEPLLVPVAQIAHRHRHSPILVVAKSLTVLSEPVGHLG